MTHAQARILGVRVDVLDLDEAVIRLARIVELRRAAEQAAPAVVVTLNPEMVMLARRDAAFANVLERAALLVPDGIGVVRAVVRRGHPEAVRVPGVDLLDAYLGVAAARGHRIALAGGGPGIAQAAAGALQARFEDLHLVAAEGGAPDDALARRLANARPEVVCAAFGHGRQELFLDAHLQDIGASVGIGVGGWLDYLAGAVRRAPKPVRDAGMEWAWRLALQPWRIRRQLALPRFWLQERHEARLWQRVRDPVQRYL